MGHGNGGKGEKLFPVLLYDQEEAEWEGELDSVSCKHALPPVVSIGCEQVIVESIALVPRE